MSVNREQGNGRRSAAEIEDETRAARLQVERDIAELEHRLSPGQLMDQALDYLRHGNGAEFGRNFGRSVRDNPLPLALVGVGLAWLMFGGRGGNRHAAPEDERYWSEFERDERAWHSSVAETELAEPYPGAYGSLPEGAAAGTYESMPEGAATGTQAPGAFGERAAETVGAAAERARAVSAGLGERASQAAHAARGGIHRAGDAASAAAARARSAAAEGRHRLRSGASRAAWQMREQGARAREGFLDTLHEHPLVLGALGVAIGAAIGAALPATRREDALLGPQRDALKRQAGEYGREKMTQARAAAGRAYTAAREEAREQGLTPEAGRQAVEDAAERIAKVASAAADAAKDETRRQESPPPA